MIDPIHVVAVPHPIGWRWALSTVALGVELGILMLGLGTVGGLLVLGLPSTGPVAIWPLVLLVLVANGVYLLNIPLLRAGADRDGAWRATPWRHRISRGTIAWFGVALLLLLALISVVGANWQTGGRWGSVALLLPALTLSASAAAGMGAIVGARWLVCHRPLAGNA